MFVDSNRFIVALRVRMRRHAPRLTRRLGNLYRRLMPLLQGDLAARLERAKLRATVAELRATIDQGERDGALSPALAARLRRYARRLQAEARRR